MPTMGWSLSDEPMARQIETAENSRITCNNNSAIGNGNYGISAIMQLGILSSDGKYGKNMNKLLSVVPTSWPKMKFVGANLRENIEKSRKYIFIGLMQVEIIEETPS